MLFAVLFLFSACRGEDAECGRYKIRQRWTLKLYVYPDSDLAPETLLIGCNFWRVVGVNCVLAADEFCRDVSVCANRTPSCRRANGSSLLGHAYRGGRIDIFTECLSKDDMKLINITAHEIGHQLGVRHTDQDTDSVMSPIMRRAHQCLRQEDIRGWIARDRARSVLEAKSPFLIPWCAEPCTD